MTENLLAILLGQNISIQRKRLSITQKELASRLAISQDAMIRIEKGRIAPKMGRIQDIAKHLDCSVSYLFRTEEEQMSERAENIAKLIKDLPVQAQEDLINLIATSAEIVSKNYKND